MESLPLAIKKYTDRCIVIIAGGKKKKKSLFRR